MKLFHVGSGYGSSTLAGPETREFRVLPSQPSCDMVTLYSAPLRSPRHSSIKHVVHDFKYPRVYVSIRLWWQQRRLGYILLTVLPYFIEPRTEYNDDLRPTSSPLNLTPTSRNRQRLINFRQSSSVIEPNAAILYKNERCGLWPAHHMHPSQNSVLIQFSDHLAHAAASGTQKRLWEFCSSVYVVSNICSMGSIGLRTKSHCHQEPMTSITNHALSTLSLPSTLRLPNSRGCRDSSFAAHCNKLHTISVKHQAPTIIKAKTTLHSLHIPSFWGPRFGLVVEGISFDRNDSINLDMSSPYVVTLLAACGSSSKAMSLPASSLHSCVLSSPVNLSLPS